MKTPMLFQSYDEFIEYTNYIENERDKYETKIFYIMRFGYTLNECKNCMWYMIETELDYDTNQCIWEWDWNEGEQFIEVLAVFSDIQIKRLIIEEMEGDNK